MFQLLKKYRKGVSPVIAIVLLIALTVAAAAVIWTLTSGILEDAGGDSLNVKSASGVISGGGTTLTVTYTLS
ncbi:MAG: archaellin/type IV pilin N-terminal domain-containing protein, partial [Candidatus Kariarchaeaceae archaeon]